MTDDTPAVGDQRLLGRPHQVVRHHRVSSLEEAAEARGIAPSQVIKTMLVRRAENDYVFVLVPGDRKISWRKLRRHLGVNRATMPGAEEALEATGYAPGTITPLGAVEPWPVVADASMRGTVSIGGGAPGVAIAIDAIDVVEMLEAEVADVTDPVS